ncbi:MAG: dihydroorotase, dihydropyrimidinase [Rhizobium sp.]|nr:dihydroorotase, dihydropyrimidinase [Rhizobium sp.]
MRFDLVIRGGRIVTASEAFIGDIGMRDGQISALGDSLPRGDDEIDAKGLLVLPGGVDAHCHIDEPPFLNARLADDFRSASLSAACGGTTTFMPFVNQVEGLTLSQSLGDYRAKAAGSLIDFAFHVILKADETEVLKADIDALLAKGLTSFKLFMTYDGYQMEDGQILEVMSRVGAAGGIVLVHAENGRCIHWLGSRLVYKGKTGLSNFRASAPQVVEREAVHRAIALAEIADARIMIVHVSSRDALEQIQWARARGLPVLAETCPQYLVDQGDRLSSDEWGAAKYLCSPPPRGGDNAEALWKGVADGAFDILSSDHCPYRFEGEDGKRAFASEPHFQQVPPGVPGLETRLPLIFEHGVKSGRISLNQFVALTATEPAKIYGLYPRKGSLMPGADADIVLWDPDCPTTIRHAMLHDACDYTPYEGLAVSAWPVVTLSRGEKIWDRGWVSGAYGRGREIPRQRAA